MKYKVRVMAWTDDKNGQIFTVPFIWKKMGKYKAFEPTKQARKILDQFASWTNLDINRPTNKLPIF